MLKDQRILMSHDNLAVPSQHFQNKQDLNSTSSTLHLYISWFQQQLGRIIPIERPCYTHAPGWMHLPCTLGTSLPRTGNSWHLTLDWRGTFWYQQAAKVHHPPPQLVPKGFFNLIAKQSLFYLHESNWKEQLIPKLLSSLLLSVMETAERNRNTSSYIRRSDYCCSLPLTPINPKKQEAENFAHMEH